MINQLHDELVTRIAGLGVDELRVLNAIAWRLQKGRETYGPLNILIDCRDWRKERDEELMDAMVYQVIQGLQET